MSTIDDIWASMNESVPRHDLLNKAITAKSKKEIIKKTTAGIKSMTLTSNLTNSTTNELNEMDASSGPVLISMADIMAKIARDLNIVSSVDEGGKNRRASLERIYKAVSDEFILSDTDYSLVFRDVCKNLFKLFADPLEKVRELSSRTVLYLCTKTSDFVPVLGYLIPCLMERIPRGRLYDEELKLFVSDVAAHEAFKRGRAVDRQDKGGAVGLAIHSVVEPSEELRLLFCKIVGALIDRLSLLSASSVLHPYFNEIVIFLQCQLGDPFPNLQVEACRCIENLATQEEFVAGMKFFAVGLVRAVLPVLRHRHAKVRAAAVTCLKACMMVPDRAKMKGAGTDAIQDLVGFREENVLQVAAFYKPDILINYLAELVQDRSPTVRELVAEMLTSFLTELPDRFDHQTRLLPYLLDLLTDEVIEISDKCMACLIKCGQQYEGDHHDDIIERRQFGVDGDNRINIAKPLPYPFKERPRLGIRLYVRGNTKRFLNALVGELTNWQSHTREKSVTLMKTVVVLCEEHLTVEAHSLMPALLRALVFAKQDGDKLLHAQLLQLCELVGRFTLPDIYVHYILPRLRGDPEVVQFGVDTPTREAVLELLQALIEGSLSSQIVSHFENIVTVLTDPFFIDPTSPRLRGAALRVSSALLHAVGGKAKAIVQAHFLNTGRLKSFDTSIEQLFQFLLLCLSDSVTENEADIPGAPPSKSMTNHITALASYQNTMFVSSDNEMAIECLRSLTFIAVPDDADYFDSSRNLDTLFLKYIPRVLRSKLESSFLEFGTDSWASDLRLFVAVTESPFLAIHSSAPLLSDFLVFLCSLTHSVHKAQLAHKVEAEMLSNISQLVISLLSPLVSRSTKFHSKIYDALSIVLPSVGQKYNSEQRKILVKAVTGNLANIVGSFIQHHIWSSSTKLQLARANVYAVCTGCASSCITCNNNSGTGRRPRQIRSPLFYTTTSISSGPSHSDISFSCRDLGGLALFLQALRHLLSAVGPSNPVAFRLFIMELATNTFKLALSPDSVAASVSVLGDEDEGCDQDVEGCDQDVEGCDQDVEEAVVRMKSFTCLYTEQQRATSSATVYCRVCARDCATELMRCVLGDSNDAVRISALSALHCAVSLPHVLVPSEESNVAAAGQKKRATDDQGLCSVHGGIEKADAERKELGADGSHALLVYPRFTISLLQQLRGACVIETGQEVGEGGETEAEALKSILWSVAVLDPAVMDALCRSTLQEQQQRQEEAVATIVADSDCSTETAARDCGHSGLFTDTVSSLISHCDILKRLR